MTLKNNQSNQINKSPDCQCEQNLCRQIIKLPGKTVFVKAPEEQSLLSKH